MTMKVNLLSRFSRKHFEMKNVFLLFLFSEQSKIAFAVELFQTPSLSNQISTKNSSFAFLLLVFTTFCHLSNCRPKTAWILVRFQLHKCEDHDPQTALLVHDAEWSEKLSPASLDSDRVHHFYESKIFSSKITIIIMLMDVKWTRITCSQSGRAKNSAMRKGSEARAC